MSILRPAIIATNIVLLICAGCASSPETETRDQANDAKIAAILSDSRGPAESVAAKRCLAEREYHNFHALDDRHLLFEGLGNKQWINTLRARCPDLRHGDVIRMSTTNWSRICELDSFQVSDWFDWPWYSRWPWHWGGSWGLGTQCTLGKFQPVTDEQVKEIRKVLKSN